MDSKPASLLLTSVAVCLTLPAQGRAQAIPAYSIATVAGNGTAGFSGDSGPATAAQLNGPSSARLDSAGNLYIADTSNEAIRKLTPAGIISTFAGQGGAGFGGDGGLASRAQFSNPSGLAFDSAGNLYIADTTNNRIRMVPPNGIISTVSGSSS